MKRLILALLTGALLLAGLPGVVAAELILSARGQVFPHAVGADTGRLSGRGIGVAVLDSGIDTSHPDLRGALAVNAISRSASAGDDNGHGTYVSGIIAGRGWGIAPDVKLISLKVSNSQGVARISSIVSAIGWVLAHQREHNIRVLNLSLVSTTADSYTHSALDAAIELAWLRGIVVVVAAGNGGANAPISAPANDPFVITVGATDDMGTRSTTDDRLASFSSFAKTRDGISKPDLVAPGRHIVSALSSPSAPLAQRFPGHQVGSDYIRLSGTSAAAPVVTGVIAQLLQARPELKPGEVKWLLQRTARAVPGAGTGAGYPRVDAALRYSGPIGSTDMGLEPNRLLLQALGPDLARVARNSVSWDAVSWDAVSWDAVSWDAVSWDAVSWDAVARD
jgi:serine protease AprX